MSVIAAKRTRQRLSFSQKVSRLAGRPAEQVRQSIHDARTHIQQNLPTQNQLRRSLLDHSRVA